MATAQQIYNKVKKHLLGQGRRAMADEFNCAYRTEDGAKCAIGCLIPDRLYRKDLEGQDSKGVCRRVPDLKDYILPADKNEKYRFANELQHIHDMFPPRMWEQQLIKFANEWNLKP